MEQQTFALNAAKVTNELTITDAAIYTKVSFSSNCELAYPMMLARS
jgi:hypothetical protein